MSTKKLRNVIQFYFSRAEPGLQQRFSDRSGNIYILQQDSASVTGYNSVSVHDRPGKYSLVAGHSASVTGYNTNLCNCITHMMMIQHLYNTGRKQDQVRLYTHLYTLYTWYALDGVHSFYVYTFIVYTVQQKLYALFTFKT